MRIGWAMPRPINPISGLEYYPFAVLKPTAVTADEVAAQNRLTVTVKVVFTNRKYPEDDVDKSFSAYEDYDSNNSLDAVEGTLCETIIEKLCEDIFNATVAQW